MLTKIVESTAVYDRVMKNAVHLRDGTTAFRCSFHGFMRGAAVQAPQHSCPECWCMYYLKLEAVTPLNRREELMDNLLGAMTATEALVQRGGFDLDIPRSPISTEVTLDPNDFSD